jgi:small subunit ribosomal protein S6
MTATATQARTGTYEVMFLTSQGAAAQLGKLIEHMNEVFSRAHATVIAMRKWDDRRLAYPIENQKRGVYFLAYIQCPGDQVAHIERDVVISDQILRCLIVKADHLSMEEMQAADDREGLAVEAKMRASMPAEEAAGSARVRLGRPELDKPEAPAEAEAPEADDAE